MAPDKKREDEIWLKIVHYRVSLDEVMRCYTRDFQASVKKYEYFCDTAKGQVVFELFVEETKGGDDAS